MHNGADRSLRQLNEYEEAEQRRLEQSISDLLEEIKEQVRGALQRLRDHGYPHPLNRAGAFLPGDNHSDAFFVFEGKKQRAWYIAYSYPMGAVFLLQTGELVIQHHPFDQEVAIFAAGESLHWETFLKEIRHSLRVLAETYRFKPKEGEDPKDPIYPTAFSPEKWTDRLKRMLK